MRMSDWSSDVCSSDLAAGDVHLRQHPAAEDVAAGIGVGGHGEGAGGERAARAAGRLSGHGFSDHGFGQRAWTSSLRTTRYRGFIRASLPHRRRSEEHTSELQSLMRISYAVFCLKKKNIR